VGDHADVGDVVVFDQSTKPSRNPRLALDLYPTAFAGLKDVALSVSFAQRHALWDQVTPNRASGARIGSSADVWAIELSTASGAPDDVAFLKTLGYEVESAELIHRTTVYHLVRDWS
jgi:mannosyltransferase